jgi:mono/diheme cytochrome c family protein
MDSLALLVYKFCMKNVHMNLLRHSIAATCLLLAFVTTCSAEPMILGLQNSHSLSENQVGELLITELQCLACHERQNAPQQLARTAPNLADVGSRVSPEFLKQFIASPAKAHVGTAMPDMLANHSEADRNKIAEAITHFLVAQSPRKFESSLVEDNALTEGQELFHSVGCVACHSPRNAAGKELEQVGAVELTHIPAKYSHAALSEFLFHPTRVRTSGRMPDMKLTSAETKSLASYLLGKQGVKTFALQPKEELVASGKQFFQALNCAACHKLGEMPVAAKATELQTAKLNHGCLSQTAGKHPQFNLSHDQAKAIRTALAKPPEAASDKVLLETTLTTFNCLACHIRNDFGGVSEERNVHFQSNAKNLGEDARIPPPLTLVGAKLQTVWMKKVLFDSESVRPYMFTRMPQFGEPNLRHLPELFAKLDHVEEVTFTLPPSDSRNKQEQERAKELREAGRKLMGSASLNCVACHNFNGKTPQNNGIELMTSHERLKPSWFYHFVTKPNVYRPRIVMPVAWPNGVAVDKSVLNGDTQQQVEAIWYFLSLGRSAPDPAGVQPQETKILVTDSTRTYRGRSSVAGYRGIAVGFPAQLNYAFNAETGTLSAIWKGDFVRVDRGGQGSGGFNPASRHIALAQDVSFTTLVNEQTPWPLRPVMSKEVRENPDPLYPKNLGYEFKGYYLDALSIPTFMYLIGNIAIEDRSTAEQNRLIREISCDAPAPQTVWFRALTGKIEPVNKQIYKTDELQMSIPPVTTLVRPLSLENKSEELLLKLEIPAGKSQLKFQYELLK